MFGSEIVDVVIGLMLLYLILSMMASGVNEWISSRLDKRAKDLKDFIDKLIASAVEEHKTTAINDQFYRHPAVGSITESKNLPSYIKNSYFVEAILTAISDTSHLITDVAELKVVVENAESNLPKDSELAKLLRAAIDKADGEIENVVTYVSDWFDKQMDYVRGIYKKWTQRNLLLLGLVLALILNADSLFVAEALLRNPSLRATVVEYAKNFEATNDQVPNISLEEAMEKLNEIQLPLGWNSQNLPDWSKLNTLDMIVWLIKKALGIFITSFAIAQGAPFWFDLLDKITNLRYNEKPDDKKPKAEKQKPAADAGQLDDKNNNSGTSA
jgi:hypothetical protein